MITLAAVQPAQASEMAVSSITVVYSDLDLGTEAGARTLYRRLKMAANHVCGSVDHRDLNRDRIWQQCHDQALDDAVAHVGAPTLLALHHKSVTHTVRHG
jgi:UrcA family protein